jgi:anti-sigma B factor antagonist
MPHEPLLIEDLSGSKDERRVLRLKGPVIVNNFFDFQAKIRADNSRTLIVDFSGVPYVDSAAIGALVGAYVTRSRDGRNLFLVGVSQRIHSALQVTRVEKFFRFFDTLTDAENAAQSQ